MFKVIDTDSHVYESEATFSDKYWDPKFKDQRPIVIEADSFGSLAWLIDSRTFPIRSGPGQKLGGTPASKGGVPSLQQRNKVHDPLDSSEFHNAAARLAIMDRENVAIQVNFPTMLLSWPLTYTPGLGGAVARAYNSWMADISSQAPDRLKWVTVIDPTDPEEAAKEIYRTKELGSVGVMVQGMLGNRHVDDPIFEPIWRATAETNQTMCVHVGFSCPALDDLYDTSTDTTTVPFVFPILMAFHRIMAKGLLDKYPDLRVGFFEAGCQWVPFMVERIEENSPAAHRTTADRSLGGASAISRGGVSRGYFGKLGPEEYIKDGRVFVGFEVDEPMLPAVIKEYGDHFLFYAADIPHAHRMADATKHFESRTDISEEAKRKLLIDNGAKVFGLEIPSASL
jgi:predicted TIM-barrel fold metal-dependent hydrolase